MKSFAEFLKTDAGQQSLDPDFRGRLNSAGASIDTLNALMRFARERHPDHYSADTRKSTGKPYGKEAMQAVWAKYLHWAESPAAADAKLGKK